MDSAVFLSTNILSGIAAGAATRGAADADNNIIAALFSAAWVEAALNELLYELVSSDESHLDSALSEARRVAIAADLFDSHSASVESKLRLLCASICRKQMDFGQAPWQRLSLLLALRNWLVHLRPELMSVRQGAEEEPSAIVSKEVHKLVKALKEAGAITEIPSGHLVPVVIAAGLPGVGRWSYETAYRSLESVTTWYPPWRNRLLMTAKPPSDS